MEVEKIALTFHSTRNMSVYTREEIRKKLQIIKNNLYPKKQEQQSNVKTFNVLDTASMQSEYASHAVCVQD